MRLYTYMRKYIEICRIVNTHGIAGTVKAEPWCDSPSVLSKMKTVYRKSGEEYIPCKILKASVQKMMVLLTLEGIDSIEKANRLRNTILYADRNDIPLEDGAFLIDDLKGLEVKDIDSGRIYGTVSDVIQGAASDIYEIKTENGTVLFPAVKEFVISIDTENGIFIRPIEGMFD